jgi:hypothetical protein
VKISRRVYHFVSLSISLLVLLICIATIAAVWNFQGKIASAAVTMLGAMDESAQALRDGIFRVEMGLGKLETSIGTIEEATAQLAQNVSDKGLVLTLLSPTKEQELTSAVESIQENFIAIQAFLDAALGLAQAIDNLPFVDSPGKGLAAIEGLQNGMNEIAVQTEKVKADIGQLRSQTTASVSKVTTETNRLNDQIMRFHTDLTLADAELKTIQVQSRQLQESLPRFLLLSAWVVTLIALWVGYSQLVMINSSANHLQNISSPETTGESSESE